jgi:hypothetical protein
VAAWSRICASRAIRYDRDSAFAGSVSRAFRSSLCAPVAQLDRAPGFEPVGRGFKSLRARHSFIVRSPREIDCVFLDRLQDQQGRTRHESLTPVARRASYNERLFYFDDSAQSTVNRSWVTTAMRRFATVRQTGHCAPVAQLDRALASGAKGRRFESCRARTFFNLRGFAPQIPLVSLLPFDHGRGSS